MDRTAAGVSRGTRGYLVIVIDRPAEIRCSGLERRRQFMRRCVRRHSFQPSLQRRLASIDACLLAHTDGVAGIVKSVFVVAAAESRFAPGLGIDKERVFHGRDFIRLIHRTLHVA